MLRLLQQSVFSCVTVIVLAAILPALTTSCSRAIDTPAPIYLRIAGSTTMLPVLEDLTSTYMSRRPEITLDVIGGGASASLQTLASGQADVAAASWKGEEEETSELYRDLSWIPIAQDGIALIVHPQNTLDSISLDKARELFAGWYSDWGELEGTGGQIQIISREDGSGTRAAFEDRVMAGQRVTQAALVMPSSQTVVEWVSSHPNAVGYVSMAYLNDSVKALRVENVTLSTRAVENSTYPLIRTLYLVTSREPARAAHDFAQFCLSPAGQSIVRRHHGRAG